MSFYTVDTEFWTDPDVIDDFTPEDKYFYLYLLTSPHSNISGCYELSLKQAATELGYSKETVEHLMERFINVHKVIDYDKENKEVIIHKWGKHHWTKSEKYIAALNKRVSDIKTERFKSFLEATVRAFSRSDGTDMVWIPYRYGMDTSYTYIYNIYPLDNIIEEGVVGGEEAPPKPTKKKNNEEAHKHGEYGWVKLTDKQYEKLEKDLGKQELERCIQYVDESAQGNHNRNGWTDWNLVVRKCHREGWGVNRGYRSWGGENGQRSEGSRGQVRGYYGNAAKGTEDFNIHIDIGGDS